MSAKSYQRGTEAIKSQIDLDLAAYMRRYNSGDPIAFIANMSAELENSKTKTDILEAQVTALTLTIEQERAAHARLIDSEMRRAEYFKDMTLQLRRDITSIWSKHIKLSAIFRLVCTPEKYQQLSKEYDEEHKETHVSQ